MSLRDRLWADVAAFIDESPELDGAALEARREALALRIWQHQLHGPYERLCGARGVTAAHPPEGGWRALPGMPTDAFKYIPLGAPAGGPVELEFRTSGTTQGLRGCHRMATSAPYRTALHAGLARSVVRGVAAGEGSTALLSLTPPREAAPASSLSYMFSELAERWGHPEHVLFAADADRIDCEGAWKWLSERAAAGVPVLCVGTAFAWAEWLEQAPAGGLVLPPGSGVLETGGFKGRTRAISREQLYSGLMALHGLPAWAVFGEYGMTELRSQLYDHSWRDRRLHSWQGQRVLTPPPWCPVVILDPDTLEPVPAGEEGLVQLFDFANVDSISAILTGDLGRWVRSDAGGEGLVLLGRAPGAGLRGCSLSVEELAG